ncbi:glycoside hydrolase family 61 protein [Laccaria bicolor S238N-H82]|uniref:lytic cellulose monooxygenase (C4-dehydrogenating) n=1 Tax=Laccaria bicolor (strain S238N-H82 / ATCC MYA-4686) TaxID=486041 RepID=B0DEE6_LACBS|nr:glycoside hydrolase family 61 protein [Laccaria bicolor S238N-H82]EDR06919.1 glycoside hydrolase family 61 protein [Laccaria bicolor S238N-H82]|eukprot:XP_001882292.1 glycoside hydrolase family 61 protein [Laccaria bicolor S238N-H82]
MKIQLPSNLAPGNYFVCHEIIALHLATSLSGAEFYPACLQLMVGASGTEVPDPSGLVSFVGKGLVYPQPMEERLYITGNRT